MPARNPEVEHALADAIRSGADRRPEQAFGDYFHGRHASCALGAAYEGMYRLPDDMEGAGRPRTWRRTSTFWTARYAPARPRAARRC
jgi:hypothetical protein